MANANLLQDNTRSASTKKGYKGTINQMVKWLQQHNYQEYVDTSIPEQNYLFRLRLPLPLHVLLHFFGDISRPFRDKQGRKAVHFLDSNRKKETYAPVYGTISRYKSNLFECYRKRDIPLDPVVMRKLEDLLKGYKNGVAEFKKQGLMKTQDGRLPISLKGFSFIAKKFATLLDPKESLFSWPYWVLLWNLMQRSETIAALQFEHLMWKNDSLVITIPKTKNDQDGDRTIPRHIFANPYNPQICPILSLAVLIFTRRYNEIDDELSPEENARRVSFKIFQGTNQEGRMEKVVGRLMNKIREEGNEVELDGLAENVGLHSPRKGCRCYCESLLGGPNEVAICHRGGWKLGNIHDTYSFATENQDQFVGRCAAGLPFGTGGFACLPPMLRAEVKKKITREEWRKMLPLYEKWTAEFHAILWFFLASLVFHQDWLRRNLVSGHPLFSTYGWSIVSSLSPIKDAFLVTNLYSEGDSLMRAVGIPPYLQISLDLCDARQEIQETKKTVEFGMEKLPAEVSDYLRQRGQTANDACTFADLRSVFDSFKLELEKSRRADFALVASSAEGKSDNANIDAGWGGKYKPYVWGGSFHVVPENYEVPHVSCKQLWNIYWYGNEDETQPIGPLKNCHHQDFPSPPSGQQKKRRRKDGSLVSRREEGVDSRASYQRWVKAKKVCIEIEKFAKSRKLVNEGKSVADLTREEGMKVFEDAYKEFAKELQLTRESLDITYTTIYNKIGERETRRRNTVVAQAIDGVPAEAIEVQNLLMLAERRGCSETKSSEDNITS
jgi:hypothetical protein